MKANFRDTISVVCAIAALIGPPAAWFLSGSKSRAAVEAIVGERLNRAERDIAANKAEAIARIDGLEVKVDALRLDVTTKFEGVSRDLSATRSDVSWIRGRIEGGAKIGSGTP